MREKGFCAVRWPVEMRQDLKIAAARHDPPLTMGEYLIKAFRAFEQDAPRKAGKPTKKSSPQTLNKRFTVLGKRLVQTRDHDRIECVLQALIELVSHGPPH